MDRKKIWGAILIFAIGIGIGAVWTSGENIAHAQTTPPRSVERWEYTVIQSQNPNIARFNELGAQGWELAGSRDGNFNWVFKRRLP